MRVLLVDDHPLFLDGLKNLLTSRGVQVVGLARGGRQAVTQARALVPDVILMDVQMPDCSGVEATRLIKAELPNVRIVMLTVSSDDKDLFDAIKSGAMGYLLKTQETEEFLQALDGMERGEVPLAPGLAARLLKEFEQQARGAPTPVQTPEELQSLSSRQLQILRAAARGLTYKEIGAELGLAERTIKYHMGEIVERLHVNKRAEAVALAKRTGLDG